MTNEEKARELAARFGFLDDCIGDEKERFKTAMEMAAWKEQQMIEKACEWLEPVFKDIAGYYYGGELIEEFKKAMENEKDNV